MREDRQILARSKDHGQKQGLLSRLTRWLQELGVDVTPRLQTVRVEEPPKRKGGIMVSSIEELVDKLKNEAKVL